MSLGDTFLLDSFLRSSGLMARADACGHTDVTVTLNVYASTDPTAR